MSVGESESFDLRAAEGFDHLAGECLFHRRVADAVSYYRQALAVRERVLGPDHPEVANTLIVLAGADEDKWDSPETLALYQRAAGIYEQCYQKQSEGRDERFVRVFMGLVGALGGLAGLAFRRGQFDEAESGYRHIQTLVSENYGPDRKWVSPTLSSFARVLIRQGKPAEAEQLLCRAVEQAGLPRPAGDGTLADCLQELGDLYVEQGRVSEAEPLYRRAVELLEPLDWLPELLASALDRLAKVCRMTGRALEAEGVDDRAKQLRGAAPCRC
jgi:tetratricopeptide (TPR) repeat protein